MTRHTPRLTHDDLPDREPWERLDGESDAAFEAWVQYRDAPTPTDRSIRKVARLLGKSGTTVAQFSAQWGWPTRAAIYDAYVDRQRVSSRIDAIRTMAERHAQVAALGVATLALPIQALAQTRLVDAPDHPGAPLEVPRIDDFRRMETPRLVSAVESAARALALLAGVERVARGAANENAAPVMPPDPTLSDGPDLDDEPRSVDDIAAMMAALEDAGVLTRPPEGVDA